jgi:hypothetical protein
MVSTNVITHFVHKLVLYLDTYLNNVWFEGQKPCHFLEANLISELIEIPPIKSNNILIIFQNLLSSYYRRDFPGNLLLHVNI